MAAKSLTLAALLTLTGWAGAQQAHLPSHDAEPAQAVPMTAPSMDDAGPGRSDSSQDSIHWPIGSLQEPENPEYRTGHNQPAPELLNQAAHRPPMRIDDFLAMAEKTNPTLAQARSGVRRTEGLERQAGLYPNPVVGYSGEHIRGGDYGGGEQGLFAQQQIVLGGKLGLRRDIYRQEADVDRIGVDLQGARVKNTVSQAFYHALTAQALVVVRQRLLQVALDAEQTVHQLANVGQADAPDILQAEVEAEQAKVEFLRAQRGYLQSFDVLAAAAGSAGMAAAPLSGDLERTPAVDAERLVAEIVAQSPQVRGAQQSVAVAEARLKDAKREAVPDLTLRAGEWWSGEVIASSNRAAGPMSFAEAGVDLPLWNRNQGNVEAAKADVERARLEVARVQLFLKAQAEPLAQEYLASQFEADRYRSELLPRARRAYELYLMKYRQMAAAYPQVLISQRTLFELQIDYLHALEAVWSNATSLENDTLTGGLDAVAGASSGWTGVNSPKGESMEGAGPR